MSHNHSHIHSNAEKNISAAFFLNALFAIIELVGGFLTNSIAILSDALHDFGDCLSLGLAWGLEKKSHQKGDKRYTYGYKRFSLLGSLFLSLILCISSVYILYEAVSRLMNPQEVSAPGMIGLAVLGIIINGAAALKVKKGSSLNEKAVYLHIMEDTLGWGAVLVVSVVMLFVNLPALDSILSIGISCWVMMHVYGNLKSVFRVMLQGTPENICMEDLQKHLLAVPGVDSIHDLHLWSMDGESNVMTLHVVTTSPNSDAIKVQIRKLGAEFHIDSVTVEVEKPDAGYYLK